MVVEHLQDLRTGRAQTVVQPGRKNQGAVAQRGVRQGVRNLRLHPLLAPRTPIPVNRVLGDQGSDPRRNVLGVAGTRVASSFQAASAVGTTGQAMLAPLVDPVGDRPPMSDMPGSGPGPLASTGRGRLLVDGLHPGRRLRRIGRETSFGQLLGQLQQGEDHSLLALAKQGPCLSLRERGLPQRLPHRLRYNIRACQHNQQTYANSRIQPRSISFG